MTKFLTDTCTTYYAVIDGDRFQTDYEGVEHLDAILRVEGDQATLAYASQDDLPPNPLTFSSPVTMVVLRSGYRRYGLDAPSEDVAEAVQHGLDVAGPYDGWDDIAAARLKASGSGVRGFRRWYAPGTSPSDWTEGYAYVAPGVIDHWSDSIVDMTVRGVVEDYVDYLAGENYVVQVAGYRKCDGEWMPVGEESFQYVTGDREAQSVMREAAGA